MRRLLAGSLGTVLGTLVAVTVTISGIVLHSALEWGGVTDWTIPTILGDPIHYSRRPAVYGLVGAAAGAWISTYATKATFRSCALILFFGELVLIASLDEWPGWSLATLAGLATGKGVAKFVLRFAPHQTDRKAGDDGTPQGTASAG